MQRAALADAVRCVFPGISLPDIPHGGWRSASFLFFWRNTMLPIVLRLVAWSIGMAYAHLYIAVFYVLQNFQIKSKMHQNAIIMKVKEAVW